MPSLGLHLIFKGMGNISKNIHFPMILQDCSAQQSETRRSRPHWQRLVRPRPHPPPPIIFPPHQNLSPLDDLSQGLQDPAPHVGCERGA